VWTEECKRKNYENSISTHPTEFNSLEKEKKSRFETVIETMIN